MKKYRAEEFHYSHGVRFEVDISSPLQQPTMNDHSTSVFLLPNTCKSKDFHEDLGIGSKYGSPEDRLLLRNIADHRLQ